MTCSLKNTYRLIKEDDEITVITSNGGIALIRAIEDMDEDPRIAIIDLYGMRIPKNFDNTESIWDVLAEDSMWCEDFVTTTFDDPSHIEFVLDWLGFDINECVRDDTIFSYVEF